MNISNCDSTRFLWAEGETGTQMFSVTERIPQDFQTTITT